MIKGDCSTRGAASCPARLIPAACHRVSRACFPVPSSGQAVLPGSPLSAGLALQLVQARSGPYGGRRGESPAPWHAGMRRQGSRRSEEMVIRPVLCTELCETGREKWEFQTPGGTASRGGRRGAGGGPERVVPGLLTPHPPGASLSSRGRFCGVTLERRRSSSPVLPADTTSGELIHGAWD